MLPKSFFLLLLLCFFISALSAATQSPDEKLFDGLRRGDLKIVESALDEGASRDLADPKGVTVLMMAVTFGQTETVKLLLEKGADVNRQDVDGNTAIMRAAGNNRVDIAKLLLEKNADFFEENKNGETCLSMAIAKGYSEFASLIIKPGMGEISYKMLMAADRSHSENVFKLIEAQAPLVGEPVKPGTLLVPFRPRGRDRNRDRDRKWGFVDAVRHDVAITPRFDNVEPFDKGQSRVKVGKNWGIIDIKGRYVMNPSFEAIKGNFAYGASVIPVKQSGKWGFADKSATVLIAPTFDDVIFSGREEIIPVRVKNLWGFVDRSGEFLVKPTFDGLAAGFSANTDLVPVRVKRKWGFVDRNGRVAIEPAYEYAKVFSQGLAPVRIGGKWGYIDGAAKLVIPAKFDDAMPFDEYGYACFRNASTRKFGCIDKEGKVVIDEKFDCPIYFSKDGTAFLSLWRVFFRIDSAGAIIAPICFTGRQFDLSSGMPLWRMILFFVLSPLLLVGFLCLFFFRRRNKWAVKAIRFSLVELLVVICIICILAGLLLPALPN